MVPFECQSLVTDLLNCSVTTSHWSVLRAKQGQFETACCWSKIQKIIKKILKKKNNNAIIIKMNNINKIEIAE